MRYTRSWTPEKFKAALNKEVKGNAEIVGKFVETEARRRLVAIEDPERGRPYRQQVLARALTYEVEAMANEVVTRVGIPVGPTIGKRSGAEGQRKRGLYIEIGSSTAPAQPYLRPAVFENAGKIVALLEGT